MQITFDRQVKASLMTIIFFFSNDWMSQIMTFIQIRFISLNNSLNIFLIKTECIQIIILLQQIRFIPLMTITFFFLKKLDAFK